MSAVPNDAHSGDASTPSRRPAARTFGVALRLSALLPALLRLTALASTAGLFVVSSARAQIDVPGLVAKARADFAIPDAPAFKILGVTPSAIMRPGTLREIALTTAGFLESGSILPESFAAEIAPRLLAEAGTLSLAEYRASPFLYRMRLSVATTARDSIRDVGLGLRFTLIDGSDLRTDPVFTARLREISAANRARFRSILEHPQVIDDQSLFTLLKASLDATQTRELTAAERADVAASIDTLDASLKDAVATALWLELPADGVYLRELDSTIVRVREARKRQLWNAELLEFGVAARARSLDSSERRMTVEATGLWGSYAVPIGAPASLLLGASAMLRRDSLDEWKDLDASLGARLYWGVNEAKALGEVSALMVDSDFDHVVVALGGELALLNGLWLDATVGLNIFDEGDPAFTGHLELRVATPE